MLQRVLPELDETKRQLQQERESNQARIRDLEGERDRLRGEADRARNDHGDIAGHTNILRKSVSALERQLQEERETSAKKAEEYETRIRAFEESIKNSRSPVAQLRAELEESQAQRDRMDSLADRYKGELETLRRQLKKEQTAALSRIRQLESELARKSGTGDSVRVERERIEQREDSAKQIRQLEMELGEARSMGTQLEKRVSTLIGELEMLKASPRKKGAALEPEPEGFTTATTRSAARIQSLEKELATSSSLQSSDRQTSTTRISRLESRWEDLKSRLLPKDREITDLRQQTELLRSQIEQLESALVETREQATVPAGESSSESVANEPSSGLLPLSREEVMTLYTQAISKLTVLMASADIAMMNPKIDPKLRSSIQDMKTESQALLDLFKSYAVLPETKKGH